MIRKIIKALTPPIIFNLLHQPIPIVNMSPWRGNYQSWAQAIDDSGGYNDETILNRVKDATLQVRHGQAVYERDSVLFNKKQYSWGLLAALQASAIQGGELSILDFGGSLGSTYYQNRDFLKSIKFIWHIVEQPHFVDAGKKHFKDDQLDFFYTVEESVKADQPNVLLLSSVLQYLADPFQWIDKMLALNIDNIIIDRTSFISGDTARITVQTVPEEIYKASYPCWFFHETAFLNTFTDRYDLIADFNSYADSSRMSEDGEHMYWKGYFLKRKN